MKRLALATQNVYFDNSSTGVLLVKMENSVLPAMQATMKVANMSPNGNVSPSAAAGLRAGVHMKTKVNMLRRKAGERGLGDQNARNMQHFQRISLRWCPPWLTFLQINLILDRTTRQPGFPQLS